MQSSREKNVLLNNSSDITCTKAIGAMVPSLGNLQTICLLLSPSFTIFGWLVFRNQDLQLVRMIQNLF